MRWRTAVSVGLVTSVLAGAGLLTFRHLVRDRGWFAADPSCVVTAGGTVTLTPQRMANAATIAAVGLRKGLPQQAIVIALATASQESKLDNLTGGDRDSIGLFQQRPSQGWGTPEQIADPRYAAGAFYTALMRVEGWQSMRVTDAAQLVQKSAFPEAYQHWAQRAEILARAFAGEERTALSCTVSNGEAHRTATTAADLAERFHLDWGRVGATTTSGEPELAVPAADTRAGWQYAHWLVAHAEGNGITSVRFANRQWTASTGGWRTAESKAVSQSERVVAEVSLA